MIETALQSENSVCGWYNGKIEVLKSGLLSEKTSEMKKINVKTIIPSCLN